MPVFYVLEIGATAVAWTLVSGVALYSEALRLFALTTTSCLFWTCEVVYCSSQPVKKTKDFVEDVCSCLFCEKDEFTLGRCLWYKDFWRVKKPAERQAVDEEELDRLKQKLEDPPIIPPKEEKMQRD